MTFTTTVQQNGHNSNAAQAIAKDEFDAREFESRRDPLPYLQMLNAQDPEQAGFFITSDNREAVNFTPTDEWTPHTTQFQNGETVAGDRSLTARFLILRKSKLLMFNRDSGDFTGVYQKSQYDRNTVVLKTRYLVYIVSKNKQLLHESPLVLTTKGSLCGSFGEAVRKFHNDMSKAYGAATGARKPRGDRFMALSILAVRVQPEWKGSGKKSWACSVVDYGTPTVENWRSYFVGYDAALKERLLAEFNDWPDFGNPELEAQPSQIRPAEESNYNDDGYEEF
ncbi:MAG: hypothetical protein F6K19_15205 [Cyanothece sp. SIO1E1]|nr:hypothetical protein [Cyanothece sp. SIO1E1]